MIASRYGLSCDLFDLCFSFQREMHTDGDILLKEDLLDPASGWLYMVLRRVGHLIGISKSWDIQGNLEGHLILKTLLQVN